jgi:hypothetical protein
MEEGGEIASSDRKQYPLPLNCLSEREDDDDFEG